MAISLPLFSSFHSLTTTKQYHLPPSPSPSPSLFTLSTTHKPITNLKALAKDESSLSSILTNLEQQQQPPQPTIDEDDILMDNHFLRRQQSRTGLSSRWQEIMGRDDWTGLLDPIDPLLRAELIRYGELAQACYDAFDFDPFSRYCGCCKYNRRKFFQSLGMSDCGYGVSRYLYATSNINLPNFFTRSRYNKKLWSQKANWAGYIAMSTDVGGEICKKVG